VKVKHTASALGDYSGYTRADDQVFTGTPAINAITIVDSFYDNGACVGKTMVEQVADEECFTIEIDTCNGGGPACRRRLAAAREPHQWVGGVLQAPLKTGDMQFVGPFDGKLRGVKVVGSERQTHQQCRCRRVCPCGNFGQTNSRLESG